MASSQFVNYLREAFRIPANTVVVGVGASASVAAWMLPFFGIPIAESLQWVVPFAAGAVEFLFLGAIMQLPGVGRSVNAKRYSQTQQLDRKLRSLPLLQQLPEAGWQRYSSFLKLKAQTAQRIEQATDQLEYFLEAQLSKLDTLDAYFVELLWEIHKPAEKAAPADLVQLRQELSEQVQVARGKVKESLTKRLELLEKRMSSAEGLSERREVALVQLDTLEDTLRYMQDQLAGTPNVEAISVLMDETVREAELHHATVAELQPFDAARPIG